MTKLVFETPTLLDPKFLFFLGVSVKEGDSPIGYFGTGLKYAIAVILRLGGTISLYIGHQLITFTLSRASFRGVDKDIILCHGLKDYPVELPFTLDYGRNWEPWQAYRELWSNTKDERGTTWVKKDNEVTLTKNGTTIIVDCPQILEAHESPTFLLEVPSGTRTYNGIQFCLKEKQRRGFFFQGIVVWSGRPTRTLKYAYNFLDGVKLTEDRYAADSFSLQTRIGITVTKICDDPKVIETLITKKNVENYVEAEIDYNWSSPSEIFLEVARKIHRNNATALVESARACLRLYDKKTKKYEEVPLSSIQRQMLDKATRFLEKCGIEHHYPIVLARNVEDQIAIADLENETIILSTRAFDMGTKFLASTLYEEFVHLRHGLPDESRALQQFLFDKLISSWEEHIWKEPL